MAKKEIKKVEETAIDQPLSKTEEFLGQKENQKKIVYFFIALIIIVAIIFGWRWMNQRNNEKAQNEIWNSELLFDQGQYEQALDGFEAVVEEYGSTRAGNTAKAYAGLCHKNLGNYEDAIKYLQDFDGNDNVIAPAILSALGDCYVDKENPDYDKAAQTFEQAAKAANNALYSPLFLRKAGLAYEEAGDTKNALKVYQSVKDNWAETSIAQSIDKYIERVK
ncbi:MAG: tetratricopeptide repeat protein [Bacteroidales bacterium]|nr:tetratricopeptide repeat protein [Bacteroidales bacterium]